jgi:hypothetical protein
MPVRLGLEEGGLCYAAVRTRRGPHLTPVVFVLDGGRVWWTTARGSVKARAWRTDPKVAGLVVSGAVAVSFRGHVRTYDALDPFSWPAATLGAPLLARAATRFTVKNARFFAGYALDAGRVPLAWTPPARVFVRVQPSGGLVLRATSVSSWGGWVARPLRSGTSYRALPRARGLDLRVPRDVRDAIGGGGSGAMAVASGADLAVLPVAWRRVAGEGAYEAAVATAALQATGGIDGGRAALTLDRASTWRAADMAGMLLQGAADVFVPAATARGRRAMLGRLGEIAAHVPRPSHPVPDDLEDLSLVRLRPERIVWWRGWTSGTVSRP